MLQSLVLFNDIDRSVLYFIKKSATENNSKTFREKMIFHEMKATNS